MHSATASRSVTALAPTSMMRALSSSRPGTSVLRRAEEHDLDIAAGGRRLDPCGHDRQAVRPGNGRDQVRAPTAGQRGDPALFRPLDPDAGELRLAPGTDHVLLQTRLHLGPEHLDRKSVV